MRKTFLIGMAAMMISAASCKKSGDDAGATGGNGFRGIAESQTSGSKTSLDPIEDNKRMVRWAATDQIKVYTADGQTSEILESDGTGTEVNFVDPDPDETFIPNGTEIYYAYYPGGNASGINSNAMSVTLPAEQTYAEGGFGDGANPMAAMNDEYTLHFKNLCGVLELNFKCKNGEDVKVKSIMVEPLDGEDDILCGAGTVTFGASYGNEHTLDLTDDTSRSVTLNCVTDDPDGVELSDTDVTPFCIVLPDGALEKGCTITVTNTANATWTKTTHSMGGKIKKGEIKSMHPITIPLNGFTPASSK